MGGTFDPVHFGHLAAAEGAMHLCALDRVIFMPNRQPPHKPGRPISPVEHRCAMVRLAIAGNPRFAYSDMELGREGPSYTVHTIRAVQAEHPDWRTAFIVGMDSLIDIQTWYDYRTLLTLTDLVVVSRPGYPAEQRDAVLAQLGPELAARIRILETPGVSVSSSRLRQLAAVGYPLRYLVPEAVSGYIAEHGLYAGPV
jgi:nicotinate-nucleotide adenylyltransferase